MASTPLQIIYANKFSLNDLHKFQVGDGKWPKPCFFSCNQGNPEELANVLNFKMKTNGDQGRLLAIGGNYHGKKVVAQTFNERHKLSLRYFISRQCSAYLMDWTDACSAACPSTETKYFRPESGKNLQGRIMFGLNQSQKDVLKKVWPNHNVKLGFAEVALVDGSIEHVEVHFFVPNESWNGHTHGQSSGVSVPSPDRPVNRISDTSDDSWSTALSSQNSSEEDSSGSAADEDAQDTKECQQPSSIEVSTGNEVELTSGQAPSSIPFPPDADLPVFKMPRNPFATRTDDTASSSCTSATASTIPRRKDSSSKRLIREKEFREGIPVGDNTDLSPPASQELQGVVFHRPSRPRSRNAYGRDSRHEKALERHSEIRALEGWADNKEAHSRVEVPNTKSQPKPSVDDKAVSECTLYSERSPELQVPPTVDRPVPEQNTAQNERRKRDSVASLIKGTPGAWERDFS